MISREGEFHLAIKSQFLLDDPEWSSGECADDDFLRNCLICLIDIIGEIFGVQYLGIFRDVYFIFFGPSQDREFFGPSKIQKCGYDFARGDGFADGQAMADFWWTTHRDLIVDDRIEFAGVWIRWQPLGSKP